MLKDRNILCIGNPLWDGNYAKTIVELMQVFAEKNKVLYVNNPYSIKDAMERFTKKKHVSLAKALGITDRITKISVNEKTSVFVLTPPLVLTINFLPAGKIYDLLLRFNGWLVKTAIHKALKRLNMESHLIHVVAFTPAVGVSCGRQFNESLLIYHCYDEIAAAGWLKKHGVTLERKFMRMADAVIVTSQGLLEAKRHDNPQCFLVKNGVNYSLFSEGFTASPDPSKRIVGYIGSIDDRLDYSLLEHLIQQLPEVQFEFIGRIIDKKGEAILRKYKNVLLSGPKKVQELPGILRGFSVGIIPFIKNQFTWGIYPLKINEYLASGIPVISTDFSYLTDFEGHINITDTKQKFVDAVVFEMATDNESKRRGRQQLAAQNSWEARTEQLSEIIIQLEKRGVTP
ncbi:MAG TPA: hypothetical protein VK543_13355 [Puia sp.]|nr:hypothetical protein [Puia sp.]